MELDIPPNGEPSGDPPDVHYLYQYTTKYKSVFFAALSKHALHIYQNYLQHCCAVADKNVVIRRV